MTETESTTLALISDVARSVPAPVQTSLIKAISNLLGGITAIPAVWLKRPLQAVDDVTAGRSAVAAILAKGVADDALKNPAVMQAAAEIYLPTVVRKARNRVQVAQSAAEHAASAASNDATSEAPDEDWMNGFMRFAEDASSERLQDLFGRILAGQVIRPGTFGLSTLRAVSELDQSTANDFSMAWQKSVGSNVDASPEWQLGEYFSRWMRLTEAGLMAPKETAQFLPDFVPVIDGNGLWFPMQAEGVGIMVHFKAESNVRWTHIEFTKIGREIGSLLPKPDYEENMRLAAQRLSKDGLMRIELLGGGKPRDILWQAAS